MATEPKFAQFIKKDAGIFVSRLPDVESVLDRLAPSSTLDESSSRAVLDTLDDIGCLRFASWCISLDLEELSRDLGEVGVPPDSTERIKQFAVKYNLYGRFLTRLHRDDHGYKNELTRISSRPSIQTYGRNAMVVLDLYNHDRLILTSSNSLDGLVNFVDMLLDTINDSIESMREVAPEVLATALDEETVSGIIDQVERLRHLTDGLHEEKKPS